MVRGHRQSYRLRGHDYTSAGAYFLTLCTKHRQRLFGVVRNGRMQLSDLGQIVHREWLLTATLRSNVRMDAFVVMPDHFHALILIDHRIAGPPVDPEVRLWRAPNSIGSIVAGFKSSVTVEINRLRNTPRQPVWQRNYHEWIIRSDAGIRRVRAYIVANPAKWGMRYGAG